jgi:hypothetical protein
VTLGKDPQSDRNLLAARVIQEHVFVRRCLSPRFLLQKARPARGAPVSTTRHVIYHACHRPRDCPDIGGIMMSSIWLVWYVTGWGLFREDTVLLHPHRLTFGTLLGRSPDTAADCSRSSERSAVSRWSIAWRSEHRAQVPCWTSLGMSSTKLRPRSVARTLWPEQSAALTRWEALCRHATDGRDLAAAPSTS